jgi:hypothetical protein
MVQFFLTGAVFVVKDTPVFRSMALVEIISFFIQFSSSVLKIE